MSSISINVPRPVLGLTAALLAATGIACIALSNHFAPQLCVLQADYVPCSTMHEEHSVFTLKRDPVPISSIEFGTYDKDSQFSSTELVPYKVDQRYGWRMQVDANEPVEWIEILTLPSAPETWGPKSRHRTVSEDRCSCTSRFLEFPATGVLEDSWMVAKGDPKGVYNMCLIVNGKEVRHIQFKVE